MMICLQSRAFLSTRKDNHCVQHFVEFRHVEKPAKIGGTFFPETFDISWGYNIRLLVRFEFLLSKRITEEDIMDSPDLTSNCTRICFA